MYSKGWKFGSCERMWKKKWKEKNQHWNRYSVKRSVGLCYALTVSKSGVIEIMQNLLSFQPLHRLHRDAFVHVNRVQYESYMQNCFHSIDHWSCWNGWNPTVFSLSIILRIKNGVLGTWHWLCIKIWKRTCECVVRIEHWVG